jgi:hypothetical protein
MAARKILALAISVAKEIYRYPATGMERAQAKSGFSGRAPASGSWISMAMANGTAQASICTCRDMASQEMFPSLANGKDLIVK